jgi:pimeloyl-ACP methyl ester carboxylesterase
MRSAVPAALLALVVAGCGSTHTTTLTAKGPRVLPSLGSRCGSHIHARVGWFHASDGAILDAAALGHGKTGVVLSHQSPTSLCGWIPYPEVLSRAGFRVLLIDQRGYGFSPTPGDATKSGNYSSDLEGAVEELKREGATKVFLMGASFGGVTSMVAGSRLGSKIAGVISLSGEPDLGQHDLDALSAVPKLHVPFLILGSRLDGFLTPSDARKLLRRAGSRDKRLVLLPGGYHGWDLVTTAPYHARASRIVVDFLRRYG